jgi:hypothetical protein
MATDTSILLWFVRRAISSRRAAKAVGMGGVGVDGDVGGDMIEILVYEGWRLLDIGFRYGSEESQ